jgi:hypothetical protein
MEGNLPRGWRGKRVAVVFERQGAGGFEGNVVGDSAGGVVIEIAENLGTRTLFVPWSAVQSVELLEDAEEGRPAPRGRRLEQPDPRDF